MKYFFRSISFVLIGSFLLLGVGCGGSGFTYHSDTEIPEGPGFFSGKSGVHTLYDSNAQTTKKAGETSDPTSDRDEQAFIEFNQWKQEQAEFQAYQQWKQQAEGSEEMREFEEWQRWREFQRWQQQEK